MRSIRVFFTENCNADCPNCLNKAFRSENKFIDIEKYEKICKYFMENNVAGIKIMGGEPTLHPEFEHLLEISQKHFKRVSLFTNGISKKILHFKPRENDGVSYNFRFYKFLSKEKFLLDYSGYRSLEVLINSTTNVQELLQEILNITKDVEDKISVMLTLDCTSPIFKEREQTLPIFEEIYLKLCSAGVTVGIDHSLPVCYVYDTKVPIYHRGSICDTECAGLIDSSCNLLYCNQHHKELIPLFSGNRIIPFKILENYLSMVYNHQQVYVLQKICKDCILYGELCNGGCFVASDINTRYDILQNTNLPLL